MSFLTSNPDLTNTIFHHQDLQLARKVLQLVISQEDNAWLKKPQGVMGEYWNRDDILASCSLINIAQMIDILSKNITDQSVDLLRAKVKQLLRPRSLKAFTEVLTEFQVAFAMVPVASPLKFLKSEDFIEPKVQRAPDFAFQTPEGLVLFETTVFYGGILDKWTQSVNYIRTTLSDRLIKRNPPLLFHISLPLKAEIDKEQIVNLVLDNMVSTSKGSIAIGDKGMIRWEPIPIISNQHLSTANTETTSSISIFTETDTAIDRAFASSAEIIFPTKEDAYQAKELVLKSLRNKLEEKKDQFPEDYSEPHIIAMRVEHHQLIKSDIALLLDSRIWPNKNDYSWLSGIVFYTPLKGFLLTEENQSHLELFPNSNAICPVTNSLMDMFNGKATFRYDTWNSNFS